MFVQSQNRPKADVLLAEGMCHLFKAAVQDKKECVEIFKKRFFPLSYWDDCIVKEQVSI